MKQLAFAISAAALLTGLALFASQIASAQARPDGPTTPQLGIFQWEAGTGHAYIHYSREYESLIVTLQIPGVNTEQSRSTITAEKVKVWVLTDDGGALVRPKGQGLESIAGVGNAGGLEWVVPFTFRWTPSTRISAVVARVEGRDYLFPVKAD